MEKLLIKGDVYTVATKTECTVTSANGTPLGKATAENPVSFTATTDRVELSDPDAEFARVNPKYAPVIGSGSGGGSRVTFDEVPTEGSGNVVSSGGLYSMLMSPVRLGKGQSVLDGESVAIGKGITRKNQGGSATLVGDHVKAGDNSGSGVAIGAYAELKSNCYESTTVGYCSYVNAKGSSFGERAGSGFYANAFGYYANATSHSTAIGIKAAAKDMGCTVIATWNGNATIWAASTVQTLLYIIGADSPLANTYENGEACLGYVVKDASGNVLACGTRKLSELLTNNTAFAPASMDLDADPPTPFLPTGATDPIEFPEPEVYTENNF